MIRCITFYLMLFFLTPVVIAQYPPAAGQPGSTAIKNDSSIIVAWASDCEITRGFITIADTITGYASHGTAENAIGFAEGNSAGVVSLGDGGYAVLTFETPIADGEGWDFAVFENGLNDAFLELAFVEVSSDGVSYFRFPAVSLTDISQQVPTFGEIDCTKIHNLAGKYRQGFGTPFDLAVLEGNAQLNLQNITHVRITDVVGSVAAEYATYDSEGNPVNDPWPTPFETGGFDLDGVGVINTAGSAVHGAGSGFRIYPNPFTDRFTIETGKSEFESVRITNVFGKVIFSGSCNGKTVVNLDNNPAGWYHVFVGSQDQPIIFKILKIR